jgi:hypothetical protein
MIFFTKPKIRIKLVNGGKQVKVKFINANADQTMTMLFIAVQEFAKTMKVEPRFMMNKIIDLDKTIVRSKKREEKSTRYKK